jgi:hypothetical protein
MISLQGLVWNFTNLIDIRLPLQALEGVAMAKPKRAAQSAQKRSPKTPTINTGGGTAITGNVTVHGDFVGHDKNIYQTYNPSELTEKLTALQQQIADLKTKSLSAQELQVLKVVSDKVDEAMDEAQQPQPAASTVIATLGGAKTLLDNTGSVFTSLHRLGTAIAAVIHLAGKLLGS